MKPPKTITIAILWVVSFSPLVHALEIVRASDQPLRFPRLFVRKGIDGNALFRIDIPTSGTAPQITSLDSTDPRIVSHAEELLQSQAWELSGESDTPVSFEVICSYHYMTKRLFIWLDPKPTNKHNPSPFEELTGQPVPRRKLELPVPASEEPKAIILKIPVIISKMGRVRFINPEKRNNTPFHEAAYSALDTLIFTPPILQGRPVDTEVVLPVVFKPE